ncbi:MAG TPA: TetR family transcriptional regulator [Acidobacteriaceae bacterium]|nr:TetR family transcriptional regulator [Acidobacteriaceae bacterium]
MESTNRRTGAGEITRKRLQQVALDLFWEKGYQSTTTRDVAASLGVQQASLYYHMKNKEQLLHGICYSSLLQVIENVEAAAGHAADPREAIREMMRAHLATALEYQKEFSVALMECRELGPDYRAEIEALWSRYFMFGYEVLDSAKAKGLIRSDLSNKYLFTPMLCTLNWALLWFRGGQGLTVPELDALFQTIFFEGAATPDYQRSHSSHTACRDLQLLADPIAASSGFAVNETYARMLDTACTLFARKGYFATSIREIADAMGIQKASLYYYISSKEDLIYQISKSAMEHLSANVQAALAQVSGAEHRLYAFILSHVASLLQHQNWHAAANEELTHSFSPARKREIVAMRDAYEAMARGILADAQAAGLLRSDISPKFLSLILFGMITNIYPWYQPGVDIPATDLAFTLADLYLAGIVSSRSAS